MSRRRRSFRRRSFKSRKGGPSFYDRIQDSKIRRLFAAKQKKSHNTSINFGRVAAEVGWQFISVDAIPFGDTDIHREGIAVIAKSLFIRGVIQSANTATETGGTMVRLVFFKQKLTDQTLPGPLDVFNVDTVHGQMARLNVGANPIDQAGNIQMLSDVTYDINNNERDRAVKIYIPLKGMKITWSGTGVAAFGYRLYPCMRTTSR